jgi:hypothetical protein
MFVKNNKKYKQQTFSRDASEEMPYTTQRVEGGRRLV